MSNRYSNDLGEWYRARGGWMLSGATYDFRSAQQWARDCADRLGVPCHAVNLHPGWEPASYTVFAHHLPHESEASA